MPTLVLEWVQYTGFVWTCGSEIGSPKPTSTNYSALCNTATGSISLGPRQQWVATWFVAVALTPRFLTVPCHQQTCDATCFVLRNQVERRERHQRWNACATKRVIGCSEGRGAATGARRPSAIIRATLTTRAKLPCPGDPLLAVGVDAPPAVRPPALEFPVGRPAARCRRRTRTRSQRPMIPPCCSVSHAILGQAGS